MDLNQSPTKKEREFLSRYFYATAEIWSEWEARNISLKERDEILQHCRNKLYKMQLKYGWKTNVK